MKLTGWITWGVIFLSAAKARAQLVVVEEGKPRATIVIAAKPTAQAQEAAQVLQAYVEKMSGARLGIKSETEKVEGTRVLVGHSAAVRALGVKVPSGFTSAMNEEGFVLKTVGRDLVIAGNEDWHYRGTIYGVYDFLERLGCRWFFPGDYGEVVPKMETIAVGKLDVVERPSFRMRNIWYSGWMPVRPEDSAKLRQWYDRNKAHALAGLSLPSDGSIIRLAPPEKYFDSHPQIYALERNGQRSKEMLCLSEPETVRIAVKTITDTFRHDPQALTFGFAPPDGYPLCFCERCQKGLLGFTGKGYGEPSLSDLWFKFVNAVAQEVKKEFPDRWLLTNGYANRVRPPEGIGALCDNIGIQLAVIQACTLHRIGDPKCWQRQEYEEILRRWTESLRCVFIYDYDPGKGLDNSPFPALHNLQHDLPHFYKRGVWGFWTEGQNAWMVTHLNYYVRAKLMWNVKADVKALVRDYCEKFYGKAADAVERYLWTLENAVNDASVHLRWGAEVPWKVILPPTTMRQLDAAMAEAERLVDNAPPSSSRAQRSHLTDGGWLRSARSDSLSKLHVRVLRLTHQHLKAYLTMVNAADKGDFRAAVKQTEEMQRLRDEVAKIDPALLPSTPEWCRNHSTTLEWYRGVYQELAERIDGRGKLVMLLPREWEFQTDPEGDGLIYQWYLPGKGGRWKKIDTTLYCQAQGYQDERGLGYAGKVWYRTSFTVPAEAHGKPLTLTFGGVFNQGVWIWVNGLLIDYRERQDSLRPFDVDVTKHIRAGEINHVAVLVNAPPLGRSQRTGLHRRVFLWSPR
ncbi:MAG: DUF4838 domain-containing protein [Abditibacteriales bacterium]|nr:DUF4838 domain-containing protein [Abditibacteriales bacterium]MDW8366236.1 DUF4838 domain-containing protein [Abditibacteriales bacterium]